jgi:hypothetical protein
MAVNPARGTLAASSKERPAGTLATRQPSTAANLAGRKVGGKNVIPSNPPFRNRSVKKKAWAMAGDAS